MRLASWELAQVAVGGDSCRAENGPVAETLSLGLLAIVTSRVSFVALEAKRLR